jgi:uncharacterized protein
MNIANNILFSRIKETVMAVEPTAEVILYGSYARGENHEESDIDLLILVNDKVLNYEDIKRITYPLFRIEHEIGISISPLVHNRKVWESRNADTNFYNNIKKDGITL